MGYLVEVFLVKEMGWLLLPICYVDGIPWFEEGKFLLEIFTVPHEQSDFKFWKSEIDDLGCRSKGRVGRMRRENGLSDKRRVSKSVLWLKNNVRYSMWLGRSWWCHREWLCVWFGRGWWCLEWVKLLRAAEHVDSLVWLPCPLCLPSLSLEKLRISAAFLWCFGLFHVLQLELLFKPVCFRLCSWDCVHLSVFETFLDSHDCSCVLAFVAWTEGGVACPCSLGSRWAICTREVGAGRAPVGCMCPSGRCKVRLGAPLWAVCLSRHEQACPCGRRAPAWCSQGMPN